MFYTRNALLLVFFFLLCYVVIFISRFFPPSSVTSPLPFIFDPEFVVSVLSFDFPISSFLELMLICADHPSIGTCSELIYPLAPLYSLCSLPTLFYDPGSHDTRICAVREFWCGVYSWSIKPCQLKKTQYESVSGTISEVISGYITVDLEMNCDTTIPLSNTNDWKNCIEGICISI